MLKGASQSPSPPHYRLSGDGVKRSSPSLPLRPQPTGWRAGPLPRLANPWFRPCVRTIFGSVAIALHVRKMQVVFQSSRPVRLVSNNYGAQQPPATAAEKKIW